MPERAPLLALLRTLRRRLRAHAALDGAVAGGAVGLAVLAVVVLVGRLRGAPVGRPLGAALVVAAAVAGAAALGLRRIALARCARLVDRALDGQDRVLSALSFLDGAPTGLVRAAVGDALARARALPPARIAPARRPRGLPVLAVAGVAAVLAAVLPTRAPAARLPAAARRSQPSDQARIAIAADSLDAERDEAQRVSKIAVELGDEEAAAMARELAATVRALSDGKLTRGDALDRLKALAEDAQRAAAEADARRDAVHGAGHALEETPSTRAAGAALASDDAAAAEKALGALAARAAEASAGERGQIAKALDAAAERAGGPSGLGLGPSEASAAGRGEQGQRRLNRNSPSAPNPAAAGQGASGAAGDRRLQRLQRDLAAAAAACRDSPDECRRQLQDRAGDLPSMAREGRLADALRNLQNAARQMRERLRRGDLGDGKQNDRRSAERSFMRAARGQRGQSGGASDGARGMGQSDGDGDDSGEGMLMEGDSASSGMDVGTGQGASGQDGKSGGGLAQQSASGTGEGAAGAGEGGGQGDGIGNQPGANALGQRTPQGAARGSEREAHVRGGAGPSRSQVIEAAAQRGFAYDTYERVFSDYQTVVEEALEAGAVPEGRRYVVRRYFQLIRPRYEAAKKR